MTCQTHAEATKELTKHRRLVDGSERQRSSTTVDRAVTQALEVADLKPTT